MNRESRDGLLVQIRLNLFELPLAHYLAKQVFGQLLIVLVGHRTSSAEKLSSYQHHCDYWYFVAFDISLTIGPKTNSVEMIGKLRKAGMNIVRMNFSHGSYEVHTPAPFSLMEVSSKCHRPYPCGRESGNGSTSR